MTMRDEDVSVKGVSEGNETTEKSSAMVVSSDGHKKKGGDPGVLQSFNADCVRGQTDASNGKAFVSGTMVWTLFDCE